MAAERKPILLRLDPAVHDAMAKWAADELRSTNAQIEMVLRRSLDEAGRLPAKLSPLRGPGRPRKGATTPADPDNPGSPDAPGSADPGGLALDDVDG
jgi:hypothetical protein